MVLGQVRQHWPEVRPLDDADPLWLQDARRWQAVVGTEYPRGHHRSTSS